MTTELPHSGTLVAAPTVESVINRARTKPATASDLFYTATLALESLTTFLSVCLKHPGFDPDLRITADLSTFYNAWLGRITLVDARRRGAVRIEGDRALERNFPELLRWSPMARAVRTAVLDGLPTAVGLGLVRHH